MEGKPFKLFSCTTYKRRAKISALDALKKKIDDDPSFLNILEATVSVNIRGDQVHSPNQCTQLPGDEAAKLPINQILKYDYSHDCMTSVGFFMPGAAAAPITSLVELLENLSALPSYDEITSGHCTNEGFKAFVEMLSVAFTPVGVELDASQPVLNWLESNRGYPNNAQMVADVFYDEFKKVAYDTLIESEINLASSKISLDEKAALIKSLKEDHLQEEKAPTRILSLVRNFSRYQTVFSGSLKPVAVHLMLEDYKGPNGTLVSAPPYLARIATANRALNSHPENQIQIERKLSAEEFMTIETLCANGMPLEEAIKAADKLN